jgi:hypothetical protein
MKVCPTVLGWICNYHGDNMNITVIRTAKLLPVTSYQHIPATYLHKQIHRNFLSYEERRKWMNTSTSYPEYSNIWSWSFILSVSVITPNRHSFCVDWRIPPSSPSALILSALTAMWVDSFKVMVKFSRWFFVKCIEIWSWRRNLNTYTEKQWRVIGENARVLKNKAYSIGVTCDLELEQHHMPSANPVT